MKSRVQWKYRVGGEGLRRLHAEAKVIRNTCQESIVDETRTEFDER